MKSRVLLSVLLSLVVVMPALAGSGKMVLQAQPGIKASSSDLCDTFYVCSEWHEVSPEYCTVWHVIYCGPIQSITAQGTDELDKALAGRGLTIENRSEVRQVRIQKLVPQYHLDSGAIVEPKGAWSARDAAGEDWSDVRSLAKQSLRVANWEDRNSDGIVGVGDRVVFGNGTESEIKAVRLGIHVDVLEKTPKQ
jgi:hypothetical protein